MDLDPLKLCWQSYRHRLTADHIYRLLFSRQSTLPLYILLSFISAPQSRSYTPTLRAYSILRFSFRCMINDFLTPSSTLIIVWIFYSHRNDPIPVSSDPKATVIHSVTSKPLCSIILFWIDTFLVLYRYTLCSKKHVTTFSMISWSRTIRLQRFLAHLLPRV